MAQNFHPQLSERTGRLHARDDPFATDEAARDFTEEASPGTSLDLADGDGPVSLENANLAFFVERRHWNDQGVCVAAVTKNTCAVIPAFKPHPCWERRTAPCRVRHCLIASRPWPRPSCRAGAAPVGFAGALHATCGPADPM